MTWELGNEPRCKGSGVYPQSDHCTTTTLTNWAGEMTAYLKSLDRKHLVSVGDEGFFCDGPDAPDWIDNCGEGVDSIALASLPDVDVMSYHLYPDSWGNRTAQWADDYITRHNVAAKKLGKAVMLGEFGWKDKATRNPVYQEWTNTFARTGGNGFLYWILSGSQDDGTLYPDYDGFTVYCPSPVCTTIANATTEIRYGQRSLPPVADNDTAITAANTPVTLQPAANDIAYRTKVRPASIDLDPATAGRQASLTLGSGRFDAKPDGTIGFTPADVTNLVEFTQFFSFISRMLLIFGIAFEIPLFVVMLNLAGVVSGRALGRYRPWIIVGTFVFAAVGTPSTDPFSMLFLAIPMLVLFLLAEVVARLVDRARGLGKDSTEQWADDEVSPL